LAQSSKEYLITTPQRKHPTTNMDNWI